MDGPHRCDPLVSGSGPYDASCDSGFWDLYPNLSFSNEMGFPTPGCVDEPVRAAPYPDRTDPSLGM